MIKISICLTDIDKSKITQSDKNGKSYLDIIVDKKQSPDQWGNDHTVYINQTKEERAAKKPKTYIGNGKLIEFNNNKPQQNNQSKYGNYTQGEMDNIPF